MNINARTTLHLSLIPGVGTITSHRLLSYLEQQAGSVDRVDTDILYQATVGDLVGHISGITKEKARLIVQGLRNKEILDKEIALLEKHHVTLITLYDPTYPALLKRLTVPPMLLYVKGTLDVISERRLAVVGSRQADAYGKQVVQALIPPIVQANWQIVSGGAVGIDTYAHQTTLDNGGKTLVVLGSGLLCPYPSSNERLFDTIAERGGAVISAFSLLQKPDRPLFPIRNRIIAGLSNGCLVVQAARTSGALITAAHALELGVPVCAVPGQIFSPLSAGCHHLLGQGARLINGIDDLCDELGLVLGETAITCNPLPTPQHNKHLVADPILGALSSPKTLDELCEITNMSLDQMQDRLFELEVNNTIRQTFAGTWELVSG